jgi:proline-specific peptidase
MSESFRTRDGRRLAYRREGAGPTLVCHPGGPGFSARYFGDLAQLADTFTLILLDPRGTGGSSAPDDVRAYTTADYVSDLEELRIHLGEERLNVLGHSHGGVVGMAYAAAHPEGARKLVALDTLVRLQPDEMEAIMLHHEGAPWYDDARRALQQEEAGEYSNAEELAEIVRRFMPFYFARFDDRAAKYVDEDLGPERPNPDPLRVFNEGLPDWDLRPDLARIAAPTLVLTGAEDFICGPACAEEIAAGIADSRKVVLDGCGHFPFVEAAERFRAEVTAFLT